MTPPSEFLQVVRHIKIQILSPKNANNEKKLEKLKVEGGDKFLFICIVKMENIKIEIKIY